MPASKNDLEYKYNDLMAALIEIKRRLELPVNNDQEYLIAKTDYGYMLTYAWDMIIGKSLRETGSFQEDCIDKAVQLLL